MFSSPFKTKRPKQFSYKPLFYDAQKEEFEQRVKRIQKDAELEKNIGDSKLQPAFRENWVRNHKKRAHSQSNKRVVMIAGILVVLLYFLLK